MLENLAPEELETVDGGLAFPLLLLAAAFVLGMAEGCHQAENNGS